jgi:ketosteroid isomerase-like protein
MPHENVEVARQRIAVKPRSRRGLDERIFLRFRPVVTALTRVVWRLPPKSRLRREVLLRAAQAGFAAINRGDLESSFLLYHPDIEIITPSQLVAMGFDTAYTGREARFGYQRRWTQEWGQMLFEPTEMLDLGDRVLFVGRISGVGFSSGVAVDSEWALLYTLSDGQVIREQPFFDHHEAFVAARLSE